MNKEVDLSKYEIRTDLAIDYVEEKKELEGVDYKTNIINGIKVTNVVLKEKNVLNKKKGRYITLEFDDVTDINNREKVIKTLTLVLKKILKIKKDSFGLVVGLGNDKYLHLFTSNKLYFIKIKKDKKLSYSIDPTFLLNLDLFLALVFLEVTFF